MYQQTETFLEIFNKLEEALKKRLHKDKYTPFSILLKEASKKDRFIRMNRSILESFSDLRNVLVHKEGSEIIAIPSDVALKRLEKIVHKFTESKTIYDVCHKKIIITTSTKSLKDALALMKGHDYTKIPVYDGHEYKGLLSGNVITRWFANHVTDKGLIQNNLHQVTVAQVLSEANKTNQIQFVAKNAPIYEFVHFSERKPSKSGVYIITDKGQADEKARGIITAFDYKKILDSMFV